jgi:molybdopterin converting factor small subunit
MKVNLKLMNILAVQAKLKPNEVLSFELPDKSTLADLLVAVDRQIGERLPAQTWNRDTCQFNRQVLFAIGNVLTRDPSTPLQDGVTVMAFVPMSGG